MKYALLVFVLYIIITPIYSYTSKGTLDIAPKNCEYIHFTSIDFLNVSITNLNKSNFTLLLLSGIYKDICQPSNIDIYEYSCFNVASCNQVKNLPAGDYTLNLFNENTNVCKISYDINVGIDIYEVVFLWVVGSLFICVFLFICIILISSSIIHVLKYNRLNSQYEPPTIGLVNSTIKSVNPTTGSVNPTIGSVNPTIKSVNHTMGSVNPTIGLVNPTVGSVNPTIGLVNPTIKSVNYNKTIGDTELENILYNNLPPSYDTHMSINRSYFST